jgi:hypothetical protein
VHLVMELCEGGSVLDGLRDGEYSERQVAHIMRAVVRFIAQVRPGAGCATRRGCGEWLARRRAAPAFQWQGMLGLPSAGLRHPACTGMCVVTQHMPPAPHILAQCHAKGLIYRDIKPGGCRHGRAVPAATCKRPLAKLVQRPRSAAFLASLSEWFAPSAPCRQLPASVQGRLEGLRYPDTHACVCVVC